MAEIMTLRGGGRNGGKSDVMRRLNDLLREHGQFISSKTENGLTVVKYKFNDEIIVLCGREGWYRG